MNTLPTKTLAKGLSKTRKGATPISLQKLIEKTKMSVFDDTVKRAVSEDEVLDAAKMLSVDKKTRMRRYAEGGAVGGLAYPVVAAAGEAAGGLAAHAGRGKLRAAGMAARATLARPELARSVTRGVLGGGGVQAIREGVELGKAKKTVTGFLDQHKKAGVEEAPQTKGILKRKWSDPWRYDPRPAGVF